MLIYVHKKNKRLVSMGAWTWASTSSGLIWSADDEEVGAQISANILRISKVKIWHCSSYINCSTCLEAKDPYCGWCSLEKRDPKQRHTSRGSTRTTLPALSLQTQPHAQSTDLRPHMAITAVDLEPVKGIVANPSAFSPSSRHLITPFQAVYQTNKFLNREPEGSFRFETLIKKDIQKISCNRNLYPVTTEEKLVITLRACDGGVTIGGRISELGTVTSLSTASSVSSSPTVSSVMLQKWLQKKAVLTFNVVHRFLATGESYHSLQFQL
uniref:Uncharacterized protein n=1 Tax=Timema cristinae TaxID=61476 RepID=A0A7R9GSP9_TIMCR|nr:unnamed protein product [Timema cristinae]